MYCPLNGGTPMTYTLYAEETQSSLNAYLQDCGDSPVSVLSMSVVRRLDSLSSGIRSGPVPV